MGWTMTSFVRLRVYFGLEIRALGEAELLVMRILTKFPMGELSTATVGGHVFGGFVQWPTAARGSGCRFSFGVLRCCAFWFRVLHPREIRLLHCTTTIV